MSLKNTIIVVDEEPYCIWEVSIIERNNEFLDSIDVDYFDYILKQHVDSKDEKRASVALQLAYHHALETFFSFVGAYIQAPQCSYAWIAKCKNTQLRSVIRKINNQNNSLFTRLKVASISWENISELIFQSYLPDSEKQKNTIKLFSKLWSDLSDEFLDRERIYEYNSMKHGFRVSPGGFTFTLGIEHEYGVPPPSNEMKVFDHSEFGLSFFKLEKIGSQKDNRSLISRRCLVNWKVEKTAILLQLISISINNIIAALKIANGATPNEVKFTRPSDDSAFEEAWNHNPNMFNVTMDIAIDKNETMPVTKKELLDKLALILKNRNNQ